MNWEVGSFSVLPKARRSRPVNSELKNNI